MGDSIAQALIPTLTEIAQREHLTLSIVVTQACPWQRHVYRPNGFEECRRDKEDAYTRVIPALHPDLIIAMNNGYDDPSVEVLPILNEERKQLVRGTPEFNAFNTNATGASVAALAATGADLVLVEPIPVDRIDPTACLVKAKYLEECRYVVPTLPTTLETLYRRLDAQSPRVWSADIDRLICPYAPVCDPVVAGHIVKVDALHPTVEMAKYIAGDFDSYLKNNRLLP